MIHCMEEKSSRLSRRGSVVEAVIAIAAERGLEHASVREVAAAAGVSIGTVQHYFPTKELLLAAAYTEVVDRIRTRVRALHLGGDVRTNISSVLRELLPLDERRRTETRVYQIFAAAAATAPGLAEIQHSVLAELHEALTEAFAAAWGAGHTHARCRLAAHASIALSDGLALHAMTTNRWLGARQLTGAVDLVLGALLGDERATGSAGSGAARTG
jgi:AcrR family transcriptional regulator